MAEPFHAVFTEPVPEPVVSITNPKCHTEFQSGAFESHPTDSSFSMDVFAPNTIHKIDNSNVQTYSITDNDQYNPNTDAVNVISNSTQNLEIASSFSSPGKGFDEILGSVFSMGEIRSNKEADKLSDLKAENAENMPITGKPSDGVLSNLHLGPEVSIANKSIEAMISSTTVESLKDSSTASSCVSGLNNTTGLFITSNTASNMAADSLKKLTEDTVKMSDTINHPFKSQDPSDDPSQDLNSNLDPFQGKTPSNDRFKDFNTGTDPIKESNFRSDLLKDTNFGDTSGTFSKTFDDVMTSDKSAKLSLDLPSETSIKDSSDPFSTIFQSPHKGMTWGPETTTLSSPVSIESLERDSTLASSSDLETNFGTWGMSSTNTLSIQTSQSWSNIEELANNEIQEMKPTLPPRQKRKSKSGEKKMAPPLPAKTYMQTHPQSDKQSGKSTEGENTVPNSADIDHSEVR